MEEIEKQINNLSEDETKDMLLRIIIDSYTVVEWPDSQNLMEEEWFEAEAILDVEAVFGSSAYFVPTWRLIQGKSE